MLLLHSRHYVHRESKKTALFLDVTLTIIDGFSKFFQQWILH